MLNALPLALTADILSLSFVFWDNARRLFTFLRSYITLLQMSQMVFGMFISSHAIYHPVVQQNPLAVFNAKL